ncbi:hypothetical protein F383_20378 [Gossypium arboreum]|uniref:Uncharacterized protein n=1 Tax=Gossypium arboreum TaxID=29729 RepID=A0A0B0NTE2_GOSAR|nr:hypothetical protein F383_20378 [Gossypium arboreum]
MVYLFGTDPE